MAVCVLPPWPVDVDTSSRGTASRDFIPRILLASQPADAQNQDSIRQIRDCALSNRLRSAHDGRCASRWERRDRMLRLDAFGGLLVVGSGIPENGHMSFLRQNRFQSLKRSELMVLEKSNIDWVYTAGTSTSLSNSRPAATLFLFPPVRQKARFLCEFGPTRSRTRRSQESWSREG